MNKEIYEKLSVLTSRPGVYIMKNSHDEIIYVGKAKNLKNRVSQYFVSPSGLLPKVAKMVSNVSTFEYIVTSSELEALILENNLIKKHKPKYNILLKDDKSYPYIVVDKKSEYPHFSLARQRKNDGLKYFGPFKSSSAVWEIIKTINEVFGLYSCKHSFPRDFKKFRPCLNYHIGKCPGICTGKVSEKEYSESISQAISFLNGEYKKLLNDLNSQMLEFSENMEFEKAAVIRDRINSIKRLESKQVIVLAADVDRDIIAYSKLENEICFSVMHIRGGKLIYQDTAFINDETEDVIGDFIEQYYITDDMIPKEIAVDTLPVSHDVLSQWLSERKGRGVRFISAQRGENVRLLEMCKNNAAEKLAERKANGIRENKLMGNIAQMLGLKSIPSRIEMYDISNFGTDNTVGGMVVWQDGRFRKGEYRRFSFDNVYNQDDYKYTYQMITRRLLHLGDPEFGAKPDIIFLDGGAGHLKTVYNEVSQQGIAVFGLVKDKKHRTRAIVSVHGEVDIRTNPAVYKFFTVLQDEVHRYAISYMHSGKSKKMVSGGLKSVKGIGPAKYKNLIKHFKTVSSIKKASEQELCQVEGISPRLAKNIIEYFSGE